MLRTRPPRRSAAAAMALALVVGTITAVAVATPAAGTRSTPPTSSRSTLATGVAEIGEPMSHGGAAGPLGAAHRPQRHAAPHRRRRHHHGDRHPRRSTPTTRRACRASAVDPGFATNRYIYLYYAPPLSTPGGDAPATGTRLRPPGTASTGCPGSRSTPTSRSTCAARSTSWTCRAEPRHVLPRRRRHRLRRGRQPVPVHRRRLATRSTRPATRRIDERTNRNPAYDAQRTAGNTNDLRGKVLRIKVNANGTYTIPAGNLFAARHRAAPGRRSTRWASATRSG